MHTLLVGIALLVTTHVAPQVVQHNSCGKAAKAAKKSDSAKSSASMPDPNAAIAKTHGGKVWFLTGGTPNVEGAELGKWLTAHPSATELAKKGSEERWPVTFLAVFKHPPAKGPATVQFVDKKEPGILVDQYSTENAATSVVLQEPYDLDTNNGFNKGHTYIIKVGQIIKNRFTSYATGEITLK